MKVIYVLLAYLLVFASCAKTDYAENGVDRKDITGYTEIGFYSLYFCRAGTSSDCNQFQAPDLSFTEFGSKPIHSCEVYRETCNYRSENKGSVLIPGSFFPQRRDGNGGRSDRWWKSVVVR